LLLEIAGSIFIAVGGLVKAYRDQAGPSTMIIAVRMRPTLLAKHISKQLAKHFALPFLDTGLL